MEIRKDIITRFGIIYFLVVTLGVVIVVKILIIQNLDTGRWKEISGVLKNNTAEIQAQRGNICADDGSILATSVPFYELRLDLMAPRVMQMFEERSELLVDEVSSFFGIPKAQFRSRLNQEFNKKNNRWFLIHSQRVSYPDLQRFKKLSSMQRSLFGSGLIVVTESERVMPHGDMASRTLGTMNKGAFGGVHGNIGYSGIEGLMESYLAGVNGRALTRNYSGRWINMPLVEPQNGKDVITTINVNLQDFTQNALMRQMNISQAEWGTAVVMEVATGNIKAIANIGRRKDGVYSETYNYALGHAGCSEPGSTFKLMSLMVAMDHGYIDTTDVFDTGNGIWEYRGQRIYDSDYMYGGHGNMTVKQIFDKSSNVGVAKIITKYYENRKEDFIDRIYNFGLNKPLGLGFQGEGNPYIKYPTDPVWWGPSLAWISYGYEIKLTPLQTLTFYNAVANNGRMVKPNFVLEVRENGELLKRFKPEILNPSICSRQTLRKAQEMLESVVVNGTGKSLASPYYSIAGKTGTAQIAYDDAGYVKDGRKNYQASFAGYFPADNPKYSCIVVIVGPKGKFYGGSVAGPVFREIADKVYATYLGPMKKKEADDFQPPVVKAGFADEIKLAAHKLGLQIKNPEQVSGLARVQIDEDRMELKSLAVQDGVVPDVRGMGASDALYVLENAGLRVRMSGVGKVRTQSLKAGQPFKPGQTIFIDLG